MKNIIPAAAIIAALSIPAFAQDATTPANPPAAATAVTVVEKNLAGDISANKLINENVKNAANESIGDINDILLTSDGKVSAVIVGVGGFLGMGEKNVALPFGQLMLAKDSGGDLNVTTSMTKEGLQAAPEYVKPQDQK